MDNIDVEYARNKDILVFNTPSASSNSVAELVFAHLFSGSRHLFDSNRNMPLEGEKNFKTLKKNYSKIRKYQSDPKTVIKKINFHLTLPPLVHTC